MNFSCKILMVLVLCMGQLCAIDLVNDKKSFQDSSYSLLKSVADYSMKLYGELTIQIKQFFIKPDQKNVKIQAVSARQENQDFDENEDFYLDNDKCLEADGQKACLSNEQFFADSYYGIGSENVGFVSTLNS